MQFSELITLFKRGDDSSMRLSLMARLVLRARLTPAQPGGPPPAP